MMSLRLLVVLNMIALAVSMSLLDAYRSPKMTRRRQGRLNTNFRPILFLKGEDDWRTQVNDNLTPNQIMDENGVIYDMDSQMTETVSNFFNTKHISKLGRKKRSTETGMFRKKLNLL